MAVAHPLGSTKMKWLPAKCLITVKRIGFHPKLKSLKRKTKNLKKGLPRWKQKTET